MKSIIFSITIILLLLFNNCILCGQSYSVASNLVNTLPASIVKGPYLQKASSTSIVIRWETNTSTSTRLNYGTIMGSLTASSQNTVVAISHQIQLTNLTPYTKYYYAIGDVTTICKEIVVIIF